MKDIMLEDKGYDLAVSGGELRVGEGGGQTVDLLMETLAGEWEMSPKDGIGLRRWCGAPDSAQQSLVAAMQEGLKRNKIKGKVRAESGSVTVDLNDD